MHHLTVAIYAINGQLVYRQTDITAINTAEVAFEGSAGIYFVKVKDGERVVVKKLVIE